MYGSFVSVFDKREYHFFVCVRSVISVYCRFYPHLFALYVIKIDESWRLKLRSTCQLLYDHILDKKNRQILLCLLCLRSMIMKLEAHICST